MRILVMRNFLQYHFENDKRNLKKFPVFENEGFVINLFNHWSRKAGRYEEL